MQRQPRVVIAGMGLVHSADAGYIQIGDQEMKDLLPGVNVRSVDRQSVFAGIAARKAIASYWEQGALQPEQTGVVLGSTFGAVTSIGDFYRKALRDGVNSVSPMEFPNTVANAPASRVGIWFKFKGPNITLADGLLSGLNAVGYAYDEIRYRKAECYLAGDTEAISANLLRGYTKTQKDDSQGSNSFDVDEVIGEGAGGLYLCSAEAAFAANYQVFAEIVGFYSGGSRQIFGEVDVLLAENGLNREELMVYTSMQPLNQAASQLLAEAKEQFGSDRVITPNQNGDRVFQYFGLNGIINIVQAAADLKEARYQNKGAVIVAADWDGRYAAVLLKLI